LVSASTQLLAARARAVRPGGENGQLAPLGGLPRAEHRSVHENQAVVAGQAGEPVQAGDADRAGLRPDLPLPESR
jgi:hypothetical protein